MSKHPMDSGTDSAKPNGDAVKKAQADLAALIEGLDDDDEFEEFDREDWKMIPAVPDDELWE
ncbi:hypothetical protein L0F63_006012, partial [Massospora cicadina]